MCTYDILGIGLHHSGDPVTSDLGNDYHEH